MKSVQIRSYFWSVFSCIFLLYLSIFRPNTGKYEPKITPYLDTFHAVVVLNCYLLISFRTLVLIFRLCPTSMGLTISWKILPAFFWWPKNYGYLDLKIHDFIIEFLDYRIFSQLRFRIEEKIHTKVIADVSKGMFW